MERIFFGIYWYNRNETIRSAAEKIVAVIQEMAKTESRFQVLELVTDIKMDSKDLDFSRPAEAVAGELAQAILADKKKENRKYHPGITPTIDFHEPVGFTYAFEIKAIKKMNITGIIGSTGNRAIDNLLIRFPPGFQYDFNYVYSLFTAAVRVLQPDWGVVVTRRFEDEVLTCDPPAIMVGWFNYFSNKIKMEGLAGKINTRNLEEGILTFTTGHNEVFSCDNLDHIAQAMALNDHLKKKKINSLSYERPPSSMGRLWAHLFTR